ncbi:TPA: hypothetical protein DDW35_07325 [Candidatus Sumerlaeota bacterium]|jgi:hypothetical protein|nr:hypothetical protein [Candidatus Sumerlaeota bacterium]
MQGKEQKNTWQISIELASKKQFKDYKKKYPREYLSCFANLERLLEFLNQGVQGAFEIGFLGSEGENCWRIAQTKVQSAKETRLYIYVYSDENTIYVMGVGNKETQKKDIREIKEVIRKAFGTGRQ